MRLIFLDLDGVLCTTYTYSRATCLVGSDGRRTWPNPEELFDPTCVQNLNELILKSGAKLVVSSSWRLLYPWGELVAMLRRVGVEGELLGHTPKLGSRHLEIRRWLDSNYPEVPLDQIVILEDEEDLGPLKRRQVQSVARGAPGRSGFTYRHRRLALRLFGLEWR